MIECFTEMSTVIDNVQEVVVGPQLPGTAMLHRRIITVRTNRGEIFQLILHADEQQKLEVKENDWLTPKVYKGKSMHEMEMDGEE